MRVNPVKLETLRAAVLRAIVHQPGISAFEIQTSDPVAVPLADMPLGKPDYRYIDQALQALRRSGLIEHRRKSVGRVVQRAGWHVTRKGRAAL